MGRKLELTWDKTNKRWKKFYRGRQYYFRFGTSKGDIEGYRQALEAWMAKKSEVDCQRQKNKPYRAEYERAVQERQDLSRWCRQAGETEQARVFQKEADYLLDRFNASDDPSPLTAREADPISTVVDQQYRERLEERLEEHPDAWMLPTQGDTTRIELRAAWKDRLSQVRNTVEADKTVAANIESFLRRKELQAKGENLSLGRYAAIQAHLNRFQDWIGKTFPVESIVARTLLDFHTYLLNEIEHDRISRYYARDNMASLKQFVKWCWELELCDLPRNFSSKDLGFTLTAIKIKRFAKEEIEEMLKRASERTRLYVLLTLNCGMQQQDIASLQHSEVDWDKGRITRKRGKTKRFENVPTVCYLLWSETFELLKSHRSDDADFVLLNEKGRPLRAEAVDNGEYSKIDNIRSAFSRLTKKLKIKKPFKLLRKTSATVLSEHKHYKAYVQHFLGQAPSTVAERHYATPSQDLFDEAIVWLSGQYGLGQG